MNSIPTKKFILYFTASALLTRLASVFIFSDLRSPEMWEFGIIARNMLSGSGYEYIAQTINVPSAYMPPGLPFIYYFIFSLCGDNSAAYFCILFLNCMIASLSILILFMAAREIYGDKISRYTAIYAALSPIYIFSTINFNSVVFYHLLIALVFFYTVKIFVEDTEKDKSRNKSMLYTFYLAITCGIFMYFRSEILGLTILIFLWFIFSKKYKLGILYLLTAIVLISPWTVRNYMTFGKFVPITTTFGYNILMGHAGDEPIPEYERQVKELPQDSTYEINVSELSLKYAINYVKAHPVEELSVAIKKICSLWIIDIYREQARHPLFLLIWLPTLALFLCGLYLSLKKRELKNKLLFLNIYLLFSTVLAVVFFNIPRYQIQMSFIMLPTAMFGLNYIIDKFKRKSE